VENEERPVSGEERKDSGEIVCYYKGEEYSPGSRLCQEKKVMICSDAGKWEKSSLDESC
jgi:hypothetical protein